MIPAVVPVANSAGEIDRLIDVINDAFIEVPMSSTFIVEIDNTPPPYPSPLVDYARRRRHFAQGIKDQFEGGATCLQAGDWSAVAIWEPPNFQGKRFTTAGSAGPLRAEWRSRIEAAQAKHLEATPFWHLAFLARNSKAEAVPGAVSALVKPTLKQAKADGDPVWLEAVDERGLAIYTKWGFELVDHIRLGVGTHNKLGWPEEGGEGISGYCMIYR